MLDSHPDIACPHEPTTWIQNHLEDYQEQIDQIRKDTGRPIVVYHHHECFTTDEMINDEYPNIAIVRNDHLGGAVNQYMLNTVRPDGKFNLPQDRIKEIAQERKLATDRIESVADLVVVYEDIVQRIVDNTLEKKHADRILDFIGKPSTVLTTQTRAEKLSTPKNITEIEEYGKDVRPRVSDPAVLR